jgi:hypothetical protein
LIELTDVGQWNLRIMIKTSMTYNMGLMQASSYITFVAPSLPFIHNLPCVAYKAHNRTGVISGMLSQGTADDFKSM